MRSFTTTTLVLTLLASLGLATAFPGPVPKHIYTRAEFQAPTETDSRSPCPGLNVLANHALLPRDGKAISKQMLFDTLQSAYNIDDGGATFLTNAVTSFLNANGTFDLGALAFHGAIEHDASLSHDDANGAKFAPTATNTTKVDNLLALSADGKVFDERDFALAKYILESRLATPLSAQQQSLADMEPALVLNVFGKLLGDGSRQMSLATAESVFKFNRLPEDFVPQTVPVSIAAVGATTARFTARKNELKAYGL